MSYVSYVSYMSNVFYMSYLSNSSNVSYIFLQGIFDNENVAKFLVKRLTALTSKLKYFFFILSKVR
jgi:hypothetical protein